MPAYWRPYYYWRRQRKRRRWIPRRRTRRSFQRKRTRYTRKRYWRKKVKKFKFPKKRKVKTVKEFQPTKVNRCKIVGFKCLFEGNKARLSRNYIQYIYSIAPKHWPSGGGWSLLVFSLTSLWEDYEHLQNVWTRSNVGLPLVKYRGVRFKFYQSHFTDYIVWYDTCWPMVDTELQHADLAPSRMVQRRHKLVIPSTTTRKRKRPYKTIYVPPPTQMQTHWYFQRDICKTPLVMLGVTAVDLKFPFNYPDARNNTTRIQCLSTFIFQNPDFGEFPQTTGYSPKKNEQNENLYLYAYSGNTTTNFKASDIGNFYCLTNTKDFQMGKTIAELENANNQKENWGNPFYFHFLTDSNTDSNFTILITKSSPATLLNWYKSNKTQSQTPYTESITPVSGPLLYECSYNPAKDTGSTNKVYIVSNTTSSTWDPPSNENHIIEGLPLPILLWGWTDWIIKIKQTVSPEKYQIVVIQSKMFDPELPYYVPIDFDFTEGYDPYTPKTYDTPHNVNIFNKSHWYPKIMFQQQEIEKLCQSGNNVPRPIDNVYIQGFCKYKFYFTWGGCPKQLEKAYDPCLQPVWPTADKLTGRIEISNPTTHPKTELYDWDWDEDYVKERALQRIRLYTTTYAPTLSSAANKNQPKALKKVQEKEPSEETEETKLFEQLHHLRVQRKLLEQQVKQRRLKSL
nr:MAG: ORF1 [TTV-like mini virus]